ncbi:MAG: hypothetical protein N3A58_00880 [Spirochaetes bacterium]|nr:hypothetical protein [Spirochaetota bacterium]
MQNISLNNNKNIEKIDNFINNIYNLPQIKNNSSIDKEIQIIKFLKTNAENLRKKFKEPRFFPDEDYKSIITYILYKIDDDLKNKLLNELNFYIDNFINFGILPKIISYSGYLNIEEFKVKLKNIIKTIVDNPNSRINFKGVYYLLIKEKLKNYLSSIFEKRKFIFNELVRVQRNNLDYEEYLNYLIFVCLVKNFIYTDKEQNRQFTNLSINSEKINFLERSVVNIRKIFSEIKEDIFKISFFSNIEFNLIPKNYASSKLINILNLRYMEYDPELKVERGAETPDKSWFHIARLNSKSLDLDKDYLDEMFIIASENNW